MFKLKNGISHVALAGAALASIVAFTVFPSPGYAEIEEIVVTANRRGAATLQDIPLSVSAVAAEDIVSSGVGSIVDFVKAVPSVNIIQRGPGQTQTTIRGIANGYYQPTETADRPLTAIYLDDVPISIQGATPDLKVVDFERVEILRGPQGTLFGAGSMAGTIRYITKKPESDEFSGQIQGVLSEVADSDDMGWNVSGSVNVPITDSLAFSGSVYQGEEAGFIDNVGTGEDDANSVETTQVRGALRFTGIEGLTLDASIIHSNVEADGNTNAYFGTGTDDRIIETITPESYEDDFLLVNVTAEIDIAGMTLVSSTGYIDREMELYPTGNFENLIGNNLPLRQNDSLLANEIETFTQEIRLLSPQENRLTWQLGAFYEDTERVYDQNNIAPGLDAVTGLDAVLFFGADAPDTIFFGQHMIDEQQLAVFADVNFKFNDQWNLSVGTRYFDFEQDFDLFFSGLAGSGWSPNPTPPPLFLPLTSTGNPKEDGFTSRVVLSYAPNDDVLLFAEVSEGFRYGAVNEPVASNFCGGLTGPVSFGSDELTNYALGAKSQLADQRVTLNATVFFIDWTDVQSQFALDCGYYYRVNEGTVHSAGMELETAFQITENWMVGLNSSYTNAEAQDDVFSPGAFGPPGVVALDGQKAPLFPEWIASFHTEYTVPVAIGGGGDVTFRGDIQYRDEYGNIFATGNTLYRVTPSQTLLNASVNYVTDRWEVGLFGTNLTDSNNVAIIIGNPGGAFPGYEDSRFHGSPRTIGIRGKVNF